MGSEHAKAYACLSDVAEVRVVFDASGERAARRAKELGAGCVSSLDAALEYPRVDAVDVCLPSDLHASVTIRALEAGRHVLVQKPIALSLEDADTMRRAAKKAGRVLMVAMTLRFWPACEALEQLAASGRLGRVVGLVAERLSPPTTWNAWMADSVRSGGVAVALMIHDLDLVGRYLGSPRAVVAQAVGDRGVGTQSIFALIDCEGGVAQVSGSEEMPARFPFSSMVRHIGSEGSAEFRYRDIGNVHGGNLSEASTPSNIDIWRNREQERLQVPTGPSPWVREVEHFIRCVITGQEPQIGAFEDARAALSLALLVRSSVANDQESPGLSVVQPFSPNGRTQEARPNTARERA